jgi:hypothetical protein
MAVQMTSRWSPPTAGAVIKIVEQRAPRSDFGPCAHEGCEYRAVRTVELTIDGTLAITYVCALHFDRLIAITKDRP